MHKHYSRRYHSLLWKWYGSHHERLGHMFVDPRHIPDDMESNGDDKNEHLEGDDGIMEFNGITTGEQSDLPMGAICRV